MPRGALIVLEGPEGSGKSTQVRRLVERLRDTGREVDATREPGGTPAAQRIREVILDADLRVEPLAEFLLYAAARAQHVHERIRPSLRRGAVVVCDRFTASSLAYQAYGRGLDRDFVGDLNERVTGGLRPDLTILLDLPSPQGLRRADARGALDRLERADAGFHERVRHGYLQLAAEAGDWLVVDAQAGEEEVAEAIWAEVAGRLGASDGSA